MTRALAAALNLSIQAAYVTVEQHSNSLLHSSTAIKHNKLYTTIRSEASTPCHQQRFRFMQMHEGCVHLLQSTRWSSSCRKCDIACSSHLSRKCDMHAVTLMLQLPADELSHSCSPRTLTCNDSPQNSYCKALHTNSHKLNQVKSRALHILLVTAQSICRMRLAMLAIWVEVS